MAIPWQRHSLLPEWAGGSHNDFGYELGHGRHGTVYKCQLADGGEVALKVLDLDTEHSFQRFRHERHFLERVQSPYIVSYKGALEGMTPTGGRGVIFMEKSDANLRSVIAWRRSTGWSNNVTQQTLMGLSVDVLRGLEHLAQMWCVHRDVAPSNILIFGDWESGQARAKLADFGAAGNLQRTIFPGYHPHPPHSKDGVLPSDYEYLAPELLLDRVVTGWSWLKTDVWSAGVVFTEMFAGSLPKKWAKSATSDGWRHNSSELHRNLQEHVEANVEDARMRRLILRMVDLNPVRRISMKAALHEVERIARANGVPLTPRQQPPRIWVTAKLLPTPDRLAKALPQYWAGLN